MTCYKCGAEMMLLQDEPMGRLYECRDCRATKTVFFDIDPRQRDRRGERRHAA